MQTLYDVPAPAKLNLFLHITGRRSDGYHLLQSVFLLIDWADTLHFTLRRDGQISREDLTWELPPDDLCTRAAHALQQYTQCDLGVHIGVSKSVPAQAGMGGGSSDAASTLLALNRLWGLNLPLGALQKIGLALGADVPFFLCGRNAWVEGLATSYNPLRYLWRTWWWSSPTRAWTPKQFSAAPYSSAILSLLYFRASLKTLSVLAETTCKQWPKPCVLA
jgi:4-diphosphocytidyl-2-C-methyl-D-erythritol kinase